MKGKWKQKTKKKKGNVVLQKYMVAVDEFIKSKSGTEEGEDDHGLRFVKKKSRKEQRKEKRKLKKAKMKSYYEGKGTLSLALDDGESSAMPADKPPQQQKKNKVVEKANSRNTTSASIEKSNTSKTPSSSKKSKKTNKLQDSRKKALLEANEDEDREIKKLEKFLGFNKRKNKKSLPQSFVADGLDYILSAIDSGLSAAAMFDDDDDLDMAKENFKKLDEIDPLSDEEEQPGDQMASEGSDQEVGSFDEDEEAEEEEEMVQEEEAEDEMVEEEEAEDEEDTDDDQDDELSESDADDSEDGNEEEAEGEPEAPDAKTSGVKSEAVS